MGLAHCRVELLGTVSTNRDIWSTSFAVPTSSGLAALADAVRTNFVADVWHAAGVGTNWSSQTQFTAVRCSNVDATGHVIATAINTTSLPSSPLGSSGQMPSECAVVCSLTTDLAGGSYRGRMYLPCPAKDAVDSDGLIAAASTDSIADGMQDFLDHVNAFIDPDAVSVYSAVQSALTRVTGIRVGRVMDAQRRRRNRLPESYTTRLIA